MITKKELSTLSLSPTNKDYYQVWNELLDTAKKLSERWDPTSTNESDPGIVLLKLLTAITDKLNYNIDVNIFEAFMPTAAQQESMRKLCDMMGYNMKYYRSATTEVVIKYTGTEPIDESSYVIPAFTNITNLDQDINFFTTEEKFLTKDGVKILCMEGSAVPCAQDNGGVVTVDLLDDNYRYYLPEAQIAENGIFIANYVDSAISYSTPWVRVENLNTVQLGQPVYKFGFDSKVNLPYIQFPVDISSLIGDGLVIKYTRTSGIAGNVQARTLINFNSETKISLIDDSDDTLPLADFKVINPNAAAGGANIETITAAYEGFKKTVGTFDTLVTCRDYMNYIYKLMIEDGSRPLVSNINVTDIRDDINRSVTICEFNDFGINYVPTAIMNTTAQTPKIDHFDLMFYPFRSLYSKDSKTSFESSFQFTTEDLLDIENAIEDTKLISHSIKTPDSNEIVLIKNYAKLSAIISTTYKVSSQEQEDIINNIKAAIFSTFSMHNLDFGEEIPFESILDCIQNADQRIKNVAMGDPDYVTKIALADGSPEITIPLTTTDAEYSSDKDKILDLIVKNILAGRVEMFNYDKTFSTNFDEASAEIKDNVTSIEGTFTYENAGTGYPVLKTNEIISFKLPSYKTKITYPAYVYYYYGNKDQNAPTVPDGTIYELGAGEYLFITYTSSEASEDGSTIDVVKSEKYVGGDADKPVLIKPVGFDLKDSGSNQATAVKTTGIPTTFGINNVQIDWMYACGPNEQIEILAPVTQTLNQSPTNLYWILNDGRKNLFPAGEDTYLLQEGEYILFTDALKTDLAYYGNGVEVSTQEGSAAQFILDNDDKVSMEDILETGIAAVPWKQFSLSTNENGPSLTMREYQYINLGKGDKLDSIILGQNGVLGYYTLVADEGPAPAISTDGLASGNRRIAFHLNAGTNLKLIATAVSGGQTIYYPDENGSVPSPVTLTGNYGWYTADVSKNATKFKFSYNLDEESLTDTYDLGTNNSANLVYCYNGLLTTSYDFSTATITYENANNWTGTIAAFASGSYSSQELYYLNPAGENLTGTPLTIKVNKAATRFSFAPRDTSQTNSSAAEIKGKWQNVLRAEYTLEDSDGKISLPVVNIPGITWQVRSYLSLDMGPNKAQVLSTNESIIINNDSTQPLKEGACIRTSKAIAATVDSLTNLTDITAKIAAYKSCRKYLRDSDTYEVLPDPQPIDVHNFNNTWTSIPLTDIDHIDLSVSTGLENAYGLIMFYLSATSGNLGGESSITISSYDEAKTAMSGLSIYNKYDDADETYSSPADSLTLRYGINIVKFTHEVALLKIETPIPNASVDPITDTLIFGDPSIVKCENTDIDGEGNTHDYYGLNRTLLGLDRLSNKTSDVGKALLAKIRSYTLVTDPTSTDNNTVTFDSFYYNCPISNELALDFPKDTSLLDPKMFYDYNNICNNFVVTEIDPDNIDTDLLIASSSKLTW